MGEAEAALAQTKEAFCTSAVFFFFTVFVVRDTVLTLWFCSIRKC